MELSWRQIVHLSIRRAFVFLDEWLTYYTWIQMSENPDLYPWLILAVPVGILLNYKGYENLRQLRHAYGVPDV